jgi:hypothetical protein
MLRDMTLKENGWRAIEVLCWGVLVRFGWELGGWVLRHF